MSGTGVAVSLWGQFDARPWGGLVVGTFNGANITMPTFLASDSGVLAGMYSSVESFVSGFGSPAWAVDVENRRTLDDNINDASSGDLGDVVFDVDPSTGRLRISSPTIQIKITACSNPAAFGLRASDLPTALASSYVAPSPFTHDVLSNETITLGSSVDASTYTVPQHAYEARLMHLLRPTSSVFDSPIDRDDDAGLNTLAYALNIAAGDAECRVRCHLDDEDRLVITWPTAVSATAPVWTDESFAARLGIAGVDTYDDFTAAGGLSRFRAHRAAGGCYSSPLGLAAPFNPSPESTGEERALFGGGAAGYSTQTHSTYALEFFADSPRSAYHQGRTVDLADHLARHVEPYIRSPRPVRVVLNHDWREYLNPNDYSASKPGASLLYSTERCTSARLMQRAPGDRRMNLTYNINGAHQRVTIRLIDAAS